MVHYLLCAVGSSGDVHPFVGLGQRLQRRGHRVSLITAGYFRQLAQSSGFDFYDTMPECDFHQLVNDPDLWHPTKGTKRVMQLAVRKNLEPTYRAIEQLYEPGTTRLVASSLAFGARVAQEKLGAPLVSVHLSPVLFRSEFQGPRLPRLALHLGPRWFKRFQWWVADRFLIDPMICPWLNEFRGKLGLTAVGGIFRDWWHSPQRVVGLFPDWFSPQQPDWPAQTVLTGFPLYSEEGITPMPSELERFLASGPAPIAFTPGSANIFGQKFFQAAADACTRLGKRGILLTRFAEQVPTNLPKDVKHFDYAPFKQLLPRCEALVHHGGIGSLSQAMAAGIGQVIMPMGFDQIDNAYHIKRLGVGDYLAPSRFDGNRLASTLKNLLGNPRTAPACKQVASRIAQVDSLELTCDVIESSS